MTVFHQMGHNSENLVAELAGTGYAGAFASPVNADVKRLKAFADKHSDLEIFFDPQLYLPRAAHESLRAWAYFPNDVETADLSSVRWWSALNKTSLPRHRNVA